MTKNMKKLRNNSNFNSRKKNCLVIRTKDKKRFFKPRKELKINSKNLAKKVKQ